ncbi:MAG: methylisocitrate lyase [Sulfobacillus thermosulfidooxidans]|uniref:Methylisocitrate lyase n=1 Tax=Sulfobacillus thermotolerans TaxID=338644 RepID=A0ABM6RQI0_9FIRM|nr:methylisocitrate lyase [Sulfobacillus sp. hq2]AUW93579.1 methylisocitrate lyase [Sulfobacillus thermotolerans]MCY0907083.1 methylisocitrate lyase [Sulfobacillus thermotolerans]POB10828.1 methylisocitrate lyase [Sulfobacillus sp. hq2]PSR36357.1 MAG: methylisocitrate lyase [Sulfobacillus thermosulfidooxidans]
MAWLFQEDVPQSQLSAQFLHRINSPGIVKIPGAHDAMAALVAQSCGFDVLYLSGGAYTASRGLPDVGLISAPEVARRAQDLVRATNLPVLVDIDTGYGGVLNAARTAKEMAEMRVAAVQIEDQDLPKKCGHLNGKTLVPADEMVAKIRAIRETVPSLAIIARTDAYGVEGLNAAVERAQQYLEAGADGIFPESLDTAEAFAEMARRVHAPLLANMTEFGRTPYFTAQQFEAWGYKMVLYPVSSLRIAAHAYERLYRVLMEEGTQQSLLPEMQTRKELYDLIRYWDYESLDAHIARTILPDNTES